MKFSLKSAPYAAIFTIHCGVTPKPRYKTTNRKRYNKALINRGSLTFRIGEEAIREWKQTKSMEYFIMPIS
ncbi:hypothetical protein AVO52_00115 [Vibrio cholerae]|nr:hypothetical protein [Vibrio cholerae]EGR0357411.1 hypothetical protein [Vibrio cholerae]EGR0518007.1 hypothetical protein [Vibrio cholerae]EGR0545339.1 hypothetical protein [Vibrio cholerae]EGR0568778.1 hypothetical protein [Vibrio cholerae]